MSLTGDLRDLSLADLLQSLQQSGRTGTLSVELPQDRISHVFVKEGQISAFAPLPDQDGFRGALRRMRRKNEGKKEIAESLIRDAVSDLFLSERGNFAFVEGAPEGGRFDRDLVATGAAVAAQGVVMEGSRRMDEWTRLSRRIAGSTEIYVKTAAAAHVGEAGEPDLGPDALALMGLLDGRRDVDACAAAVPFGRFRLYEVLGELLDARLIRPATLDELTSLGDAAEREGDVDGAVAHYRRILEVARNALPVRERLALLLERTGRRDEAAHERKLLGHARAAMGDLAGAIADYGKAGEMAPDDPVPLERALELERSRRNEAGSFTCAKRLAERYRALGLTQRAREVYAELHDAHPADIEIAEQLEEMLRRSGLVPAATRVRKKIDDIESGRAAARKHSRRRASWFAAATLVAALGGVGLARELLARADLKSACAATFLSPTGNETQARWVDEFMRVAARHPWTLAGRDARDLAGELVEKEAKRMEQEERVAAD